MRHAKRASFYKMSIKDKVQQILNDLLTAENPLFLIDLKVSDANKIEIVLDGDQGVSLQDCIEISRKVEAELDSETLDFSLDVCSAGVSSPLKFVRQYKKNIGRTLKVKTISQGEIQATLIDANEEEIVLNWKAREPKPQGKGKITVEKNQNIPYSEIKESVVIISF